MLKGKALNTLVRRVIIIITRVNQLLINTICINYYKTLGRYFSPTGRYINISEVA